LNRITLSLHMTGVYQAMRRNSVFELKNNKVLYIVLFAAVQGLLLTGCGYADNAQIKTEAPAGEPVKTESYVGAATHGTAMQPAEQNSSEGEEQGTGRFSKNAGETRSYWPTKDWVTSSPADQGMDQERLSKIKEYYGQYSSEIHSLLIVRNGYLVFEEYYNGYTQSEKNNLQSVTKSFVSALTGIAIKEGFLESADQKVKDIFPEYFADAMDGRKSEIKIEHLLTMSAGFKWEQNGKIRNEWLNSKDRNKYLINLPLEAEPGEKFCYSSGVSHLMSGILTKTAGMSTVKFADKYLFHYLGIGNRQWNTDNRGCCLGNTGLYLTPRDMAKFGFLYLNNGYWEGKQVIPAQWIKESTERQIGIGSDYADYGYNWWIKTMSGQKFYFAQGYGGQYIFVIPDLDIVAVITSRWDRETMEPDFFMTMIDSYVIGAVG
jgi:CubicO group peptidase (beta-lactamase class C family)